MQLMIIIDVFSQGRLRGTLKTGALLVFSFRGFLTSSRKN